MSDPARSDPRAIRPLGPALARGFLGRCPACGKGRCLHGFISPEPVCAVCGENLEPYQTADFAPYLVTFIVGLVFTPLILLANNHLNVSTNLSVTIGLIAALACAMILLPRIKGAVIGLLWSMDVQAGQ